MIPITLFAMSSGAMTAIIIGVAVPTLIVVLHIIRSGRRASDQRSGAHRAKCSAQAAARAECGLGDIAREERCIAKPLL